MPLYYFKAKSKFGLLGKKGKLLDTGTNENNMFREKNAYLQKILLCLNMALSM